MGSPAVAAWIAHLAFWVLLARGWTSGDLGIRGTVIALALWLTAYIGLPFLPYGAAFFPSLVAVIDIALVFVIFKGDVHITER
jgi:hypothetical protein